MMFSATGGVRCYDLTKSDRFPILVAADGVKSLIVKSSTCKGCEHYGTVPRTVTRRPRVKAVPFCAIHRERNKTLIADTRKGMDEDVARVVGTTP